MGSYRNEVKKVGRSAKDFFVTSAIFNLFIGDLGREFSSEVPKFVDDTQLFRMMKTQADWEELQKACFILSEWATKWQIKFASIK